ncbi:hypothetical protein [Ferruginibacter sp.]|nr:hypothetical protein [Ferruginibacter sp.]
MTANISINSRNNVYEFITESSVRFSASESGNFKKSIIINTATGSVTILKKTGWFKTKYEINFPDGKAGIFEGFGGLKSNYVLTFENEKYFLYGHKGLLTSIFFNKNQIGYIEQEKKAIKGTTKYKLIANKDIDFLICWCLILMLHNTSNSSSELPNDIDYDLGNIGPEEFGFNYDWKPIC